MPPSTAAALPLDPWLAGAAWLGCALLLARRLRRPRSTAGGLPCASCPAGGRGRRRPRERTPRRRL